MTMGGQLDGRLSSDLARWGAVGSAPFPPSISMIKMFEKSKWCNLPTVNAMLPFILRILLFLEKYLSFLYTIFFVIVSQKF